MKRSRSVELALMGAVPFLLSACNRPEAAQPVLYQSVQQCSRDGQITADECQRQYDQAVAQHAQTAPRFNTINDCAAQYGYDQCHPIVSSNGNSVFMPALAGFMIGRMMSHPHYHHYYGGFGSGWGSQPLYRERGDRGVWRSGNGESVGFGRGARGPAAATTAETLSRGGFGHASAARGSWGG